MEAQVYFSKKDMDVFGPYLGSKCSSYSDEILTAFVPWGDLSRFLSKTPDMNAIAVRIDMPYDFYSSECTLRFRKPSGTGYKFNTNAKDPVLAVFDSQLTDGYTIVAFKPPKTLRREAKRAKLLKEIARSSE